MSEVQSCLRCSFLKEKTQEKLLEKAQLSWERQGWEGGEDRTAAKEGVEPPLPSKPEVPSLLPLLNAAASSLPLVLGGAGFLRFPERV